MAIENDAQRKTSSTIIERDLTFDMMKGIGILLVLLGHVWQWSATSGHVILSFHMPLFFIVAGYFSKSWDETEGMSRWKIIGRYLKRLYVPFLFSMSLIVFWFAIKSINNTEFVNRLITSLISVVWASTMPLPTPWGNASIGAIWFLLALLWAKVFFLGISHFGKWTLPIALVLSLAAVLGYPYIPPIPGCIITGLMALPFVVIGWYWRRIQIPCWCAWMLAGVWILAIIFSNLDMFDGRFDCWPLDIVGACGGTYVVYWICKLLSRYLPAVSKFLAYIGVCSLAILCWHNVDISANVLHQLLCFACGDIPVPLDYIIRYVITIGLAIASMNLPYIKKIFA